MADFAWFQAFETMNQRAGLSKADIDLILRLLNSGEPLPTFKTINEYVKYHDMRVLSLGEDGWQSATVTVDSTDVPHMPDGLVVEAVFYYIDMLVFLRQQFSDTDFQGYFVHKPKVDTNEKGIRSGH
jgi:hypothetical protein